MAKIDVKELCVHIEQYGLFKISLNLVSVITKYLISQFVIAKLGLCEFQIGFNQL